MVVDPLRILITEPRSTLDAEQEAARITELLESGAFTHAHLRKPDDEARAEALLKLIPATLRNRLRVHRFPRLAKAYGVGYHCADGEQAPMPRCSRSCHSPEQLALYPDAPYLFLSPVFPSISKPGYTPAGTRRVPNGAGRVVALGGVTPQRLPALTAAGFAGGALLGHAWRTEPAALITEMNRARAACLGFSLQFITSAPTAALTARQAIEAVRGGCRWVQVRMKDAPDREVAEAVRLIAEAHLPRFILLVDDRVHLAASMPQIDGVHLGHDDMPRQQARAILGPSKIIGSTANTPQQALALAPVSDYLGVGPFRFTTTKKRLAPLLGASGIERVVSALAEAGLYTPVVAIGGITEADVPTVLAMGAAGIAVSGAISSATDPARATTSLLKTIDSTHRHEHTK